MLKKKLKNKLKEIMRVLDDNKPYFPFAYIYHHEDPVKIFNVHWDKYLFLFKQIDFFTPTDDQVVRREVVRT